MNNDSCFNDAYIKATVYIFDVDVVATEKKTNEIVPLCFSVAPCDVIDLFTQVKAMFPPKGEYDFIGINAITVREEVYEIPTRDFIDVASPQ